LGNLEWGSSTRDFERWTQGVSRNGAFLSEEAQCGGPLGRVPLLGTLKDMLIKALDMGISLHRGPVVEPGGDSLTGTFREKDCIFVFLSWTQRVLRF
jgi:hypothetical protein